MILNDNNSSEVSVLGNIEKNEVSIDARNLSHIVTILSSNLYSHPLQSFIRETVSNAVDSHREAGVDRPVIMTLSDNYIAIRDYGTGISPERFKEIYTNIGSSTKRESNDYIGAFGIGRFSCLAVADMANITSFYNGKAYYYVMNKDVTSLHIDLLEVKDTDEHNGVEVKVPYSVKIQYGDLYSVLFVKDLYVNDTIKYSYIGESFNERTLETHSNFRICTNLLYETRILVGDISYVVNYDVVGLDKVSFASWNNALNTIVPQLQIGEVDITPNREALIYTERTKKAVQKAVANTIQELKDLWKKQCENTDYDIIDYLGLLRNRRHTLQLATFKITLGNDLPEVLHYKNLPSSDNPLLTNIGDSLDYYALITLLRKYSKDSKKWRKEHSTVNITALRQILSKEHTALLALPSVNGLSSKYLYKFLVSKFPDKHIYLLESLNYLSEVRRFINHVLYGQNSDIKKRLLQLSFFVIREIINYLKDRIPLYDVFNSPEYLQYKKDNKPTVVSKSKSGSSEITMHIYNTAVTSSWENVVCKEKAHPLDIVQRIHRESKRTNIVYAELDNYLINALVSIRYPNLHIIALSKANYKLAKAGLLFPKYVKDIESLNSIDNRVLQKLATIRYIKRNDPNISLLPTYYPSISLLPAYFPAQITEACNKLVSLDEYTTPTYDNALLDMIPEEKYDRNILALYNKVKGSIEIYNRVRQMPAYQESPYLYYSLMKSKVLRMNYNSYAKILKTIKTLKNYENCKNQEQPDGSVV